MCKPLIGQLGMLQFSQVKDTTKNFFSSFYMHLKFKKCFQLVNNGNLKTGYNSGSYFIKKQLTGRGLPTTILPALIGSASTPTRPPVQLSSRSRLWGALAGNRVCCRVDLIEL
jgi:hypothetical protein